MTPYSINELLEIAITLYILLEVVSYLSHVSIIYLSFPYILIKGNFNKDINPYVDQDFRRFPAAMIVLWAVGAET